MYCDTTEDETMCKFEAYIPVSTHGRPTSHTGGMLLEDGGQGSPRSHALWYTINVGWTERLGYLPS